MKHWISRITFASLLLTALGACAPQVAQGTRIRVATATPAQLEAVKNDDTVWFEFQKGDVVPVMFGFLGAVEGGNEEPVLLRAKRRFFFVMTRSGKMRISFDGKTFAGPRSNQAVIAVMPRDDGTGAEVGWILYIGESGNVQAELDGITKQ